MNEKEILKRMSLNEKIAYCSGADFWHTKRVPSCNVESIMMADGPHGLRKQEDSADMLGINESVKATSFPTASILACSFDTDLVSRVGDAIALEAKETRFIAWDIAITPSGPEIIEANESFGSVIMQLYNKKTEDGLKPIVEKFFK